MTVIQLVGLIVFGIGLFVALGIGMFLLWRNTIKPMMDTKFNLRQLAIFKNTSSLILHASEQHDIPMEETVAALNAAVEVYNESVRGENKSAFLLERFPLTHNSLKMQKDN